MTEPAAAMASTECRDRMRSASPFRYWRSWLPELAVLTVLGLAATLLFTGTGLDMRIAAAFRNGGRFPRPSELSFPWRHLYGAAGASVAVMSAAAALALAAGLRSPAWRRWRRHAAFALLAFAIGPGVVVNIGFKNFWGRPRPVHVRELGGAWSYQDAVERGRAGRGKSFPCGHSSAGYTLTAFWLMWKRRHPRRALAALAIALAYGTALGVGRMMTGSHFASDVIASGLLVHLSNVLLYYFALNIPGREDGPPPQSLEVRLAPAAIAGWGGLGVAVVVASFVATPYHSEFAHLFAGGNGDRPTASALELALPHAQVMLTLHPSDQLSVSGEAEGFGMFGSQLQRVGPAPAADGALRFEARPTGWFSDLSLRLDVRVPTGGIAAVRVSMPGGGLSVAAPDPAPWAVDLSEARALLASAPTAQRRRGAARAADSPADDAARPRNTAR